MENFISTPHGALALYAGVVFFGMIVINEIIPNLLISKNLREQKTSEEFKK